jgi:hypothetical protein
VTAWRELRLVALVLCIGWIKTVDEYYNDQVRSIIGGVIQNLIGSELVLGALTERSICRSRAQVHSSGNCLLFKVHLRHKKKDFSSLLFRDFQMVVGTIDRNAGRCATASCRSSTGVCTGRLGHARRGLFALVYSPGLLCFLSRL